METNDFIKHINDKRKAGGWYTFVGTVNGKQVKIKGFETWLQVYSVNGLDFSGAMDIKVKEYNRILKEGIN